MKNALQDALAVIHRHKKEFLILNVAFFGLFLLTMTFTLFNPGLQPVVAQAISGIVRMDLAAEIYGSGNIPLAVGATLMVNMIVAVLLIALPSLIVPFFGVAFALVFAAIYGITLAPIGPYAAAMIPHSVAVVIEFEAYIIAAFGAYVFGRTVFFPPMQNSRSFGQRYADGVRIFGLLHLLVASLLVVGALYEVFEIFFLVRYFV